MTLVTADDDKSTFLNTDTESATNIDMGYTVLQLLEPTGLFRPSAHAIHAVDPLTAEKVPDRHTAHTLLPFKYAPAMQAERTPDHFRDKHRITKEIECI